MNRIAIIGSGITGLSVAYHLPQSSTITFFDKSRRPGGRVSTRTTRQYPSYSFDHGTPFINPKGQFLALLQELNALQQVKLRSVKSLVQQQISEAKEKTFFIGNKKIESIPLSIMKKLNEIHKVQQIYNSRINLLSEQANNEYWLQDQNGKKYGPYNFVCFAIPYPQCLLINQKAVQFTKQYNQKVAQTNSYDCDWVVMVAIKPDSEANQQFIKIFNKFDICEQISDKIAFGVSQKHKGYQGEDSLWVFTMDKLWNQQNVDLKPEQVEQVCLKELSSLVSAKSIKPTFIKSHRWLYAHPKTANYSIMSEKNAFFCGDWAQNCQDLQQCWDLGQKVSSTILQSLKKSHL